MNRCPYCGRYMQSHIERAYDGGRVIWTCPCGYSNRNDTSIMDNKITYKPGSMPYANRTL